MVLNVAVEPVPIEIDATGTARVGGTRLTLDTVIEMYDAGASPERIAEGFPPLSVADAYVVLAYVLRHRPEVDAYRRRREEQAAQVRAKIEAQEGSRGGLRERLISRRNEQKHGGRI